MTQFGNILPFASTSVSLSSCSFVSFMIRDARVMWDNKTGRSRGYGFVSFRNQQA
jgi:nucleolysin TIA-1/TIAR